MSAKVICHVINYGGLTAGSFISAMQALASAASARGDRFVLLAKRFTDAAWWQEARATGVDLQLFETNRELKSKLRALRPDIVHTHFTAFDTLAVRIGSNCRVFWHVHSHRQNRSLRARFKALIKYRILGSRVHIVAVSNVLRDECINFCAADKRVHAIHNGIDTDHFRPATPDERAVARAKYNIGTGDRVVLFFERVPYKGGATLRKALKLLVGIRLIVVGGSTEDRDRFGGSPYVISIARVADTRELYWASDALAFASDHEGFGLVVAEALACSLPIAASDIPIIEEVCGDADGVALFPVGNAERMSHSLLRALSEKRNGNGRQRAVTEFSLARWTSRILELYDESSRGC